MTRGKDLLTVAVSALLFCFLGGIIGFTIGRFSPGYYRAVSNGGDLPDFDPVQVGVGFGTTQGFVGGIIVGLIIVLSHRRSKEILQFLHKYRWLFLATGLIVAAVCYFISLAIKSVVHNHNQWMYRAYVEDDYLPDQKKVTGKWPKDLRGLPNYIRTKKKQTEDQDYDREWLDDVLRYHRNNYEGLEPVQSSNKKYSFNLRLRDQTIECETTIDDTQ